jgi:chromosome segregation ATPase
MAIDTSRALRDLQRQRDHICQEIGDLEYDIEQAKSEVARLERELEEVEEEIDFEEYRASINWAEITRLYEWAHDERMPCWKLSDLDYVVDSIHVREHRDRHLVQRLKKALTIPDNRRELDNVIRALEDRV